MQRPAPRVVVVADRSAAALPGDAAERVAAGWSARAPHVHVDAFASHDGGSGFAALVAERFGGVVHPVVVPGPDGEDVPAAITLVDAGGTRTAYLDTAQACGRALVTEQRLLDPTGLRSDGVGQLLLRARELGARRIVVGVGPLACHDGGAGLLAALGAGDDLSGLRQVRDEWAGVTLTSAVTSEATLLGFHGASATLGDLGVAPETTQRLETRFGELTDRVNGLLPPARDLLTGLPRRPEREPGSGVGGGVGYALQLLGARTDTGARLLLDELGIRARLPGALLVMVTHAYDVRTVHDGVVAATARAALETATPTVVLAQEVAIGRREGMSLGVSGAYDVRDEEDLEALAARVARTWTPPPAAPEEVDPRR